MISPDTIFSRAAIPMLAGWLASIVAVVSVLAVLDGGPLASVVAALASFTIVSVLGLVRRQRRVPAVLQERQTKYLLVIAVMPFILLASWWSAEALIARIQPSSADNSMIGFTMVIALGITTAVFAVTCVLVDRRAG